MKLLRVVTTGLLAAPLLLGTATLGARSVSFQPVNQKKKRKKHKIRPSVAFARTWEAAVSEARLLKLPLVVHLHGFY